VSNTRLVQKVI